MMSIEITRHKKWHNAHCYTAITTTYYYYDCLRTLLFRNSKRRYPRHPFPPCHPLGPAVLSPPPPLLYRAAAASSTLWMSWRRKS